MQKEELIILQNLLQNSAYFYKVFSKINENNFEDRYVKLLIKKLKKFYNEFDKKPSIDEFELYVLNEINDLEKQEIQKIFNELKTPSNLSLDFLISFTEKYLKKVSLVQTIIETAEKIKKNDIDYDIIVKFEQALDYKFDNDVGIELTTDLDRYKYYIESFNTVSTGIKSLDELLGGGIRLNPSLIIMAGPSFVGKTAFLCHLTATLTKQKKNGLYITLEMPEYDIAKRIDANILDIPIYEIEKMGFETYKKLYEGIKDHLGKLYIKEYPAGSFSIFDLEKLLYDIENDNKIKIDYIVIDYLGLMKSTRTKLQQGSYTYFKSISEEIHGFSKKHKVPILTGFQLNRSAYNNLDAGVENISESMGVIMTADVVILMLTNEQLKEQKQLMLKIEKNRWTGNTKKALCRVDWPTMKFKDVNEFENKETKIIEEKMESDIFNMDINFDGIEINFD